MPTQSQLKLKTVELNRYPTVKVELHGRFMLPSRTEHECSVIEMSTREIKISAPVAPEIGEKIIIYIAELGRFEGGVVRQEAAGFAIGMSLPKAKHVKLAEQLTWYGNREAWDLPDNRRYERIVPFTRRTPLHLSDGKELSSRSTTFPLAASTSRRTSNCRRAPRSASARSRRPCCGCSTMVSSPSSTNLSRKANSTNSPNYERRRSFETLRA